MVDALPNRRRSSQVLGLQALKSATSIGANYREALRASSKRHFTTTIEIAARESDESVYWLELIAESGLIRPNRLSQLLQEGNELLAILAATARTARNRPQVAPRNRHSRKANGVKS
jgi:four helix bundle protein